MFRMVLRRSAALLTVCLVTACGPTTARTAARPAGGTIPPTARSAGATGTASPAVPATGGPGYSAALSARLVTADAGPAGLAVDIATTMAPDAGDRRPTGDVPCSEMIPLLSAARLTGTPSAIAAATLSFETGPDDLWVGAEVLRTYADEGARRAMSDLRTFIGRCPTVASPDQGGGSYRYSVSAGPPLGDESLHVGCTTTSGTGTLQWDSILVRVGTTLVAVKEQGNTPSDGRYLTQLTEAALRRYQATGS